MTFDQRAKEHQEEHIIKLKSRLSPEEIEIEDIRIIVNPDVFSPASDTKILAKYLNTKKGGRVLDLTTGSGILAVIAARQGAKVTAVDINPAAIKNANENFTRLGLSVQAVVSDLFENVAKNKFDLIIVNGPYFNGKVSDPLEYASLDVSNFLEKLFGNARKYLKNSGKILITFAEFGEIQQFYSSIANHGFTYRKLDTKTSKDGLRSYGLFEVK